MVEFEMSSNLMVQVEKPIAMEVYTVERVHRDRGRMCDAGINGVHAMRVRLLMFSRCSRLVGQVENHILEVLMIDRSARLLVQPKFSKLVHKVKKDLDKCMEGCFGYLVEPENMEKGTKTRNERKHRRRRSKHEEKGANPAQWREREGRFRP